MLLKTHSFVKARCRKLPAAFAPGIGRLPSTRVVAHPMPPGLTYLSHQLRFREKLLRASSRDDMAGNQNNGVQEAACRSAESDRYFSTSPNSSTPITTTYLARYPGSSSPRSWRTSAACV